VRRDDPIASTDDVSDPIDAVYLWVDGAEPEFRASLARALAGRPPGGRPDASPRRFRDNGELRHSLRSLERHAPWIRRVHLVTNGQVPAWLDTSAGGVSLVTHREIFPGHGALPTFNSNAVEWCLHAVPGLARRFVYFNDDLFLCRDVGPGTWVRPDGGLRLYFEENRIRTRVRTGATHDLAYAHTLRAIDRSPPRFPRRRHAGAYDLRFLDRLRLRAPRRMLPAHVPQLYDRDLLVRLTAVFADAVRATVAHPFRSPDDLVLRIVYAFHALETPGPRGAVDATRLAWDSEDYAFAPLVDDAVAVEARLARIAAVAPRFVCVNDELGDEPGADHPSRRAFTAWMRATFPKPSRFERTA
jgi:hypothetical protein